MLNTGSFSVENIKKDEKYQQEKKQKKERKKYQKPAKNNATTARA